jgi:4-hydroxy-L-threonine phosphate dehydrogenase PdxA
MSTDTIGITSGDPSGVGPEIICKALADLPESDRHATVVFGTREVLQRANALVGSHLRFVEGEAAAGLGPREVRVVHVPVPDGVGAPEDGTITAAGGACAYAYIAAAVDAALQSRIGVIVTAPINKAALHRAGYKFDGHTELLAHLTGANSSFMLLASEKLSTLHVSTHVALGDAVKRASTERVLATIRQGHAHLRRLAWSGRALRWPGSTRTAAREACSAVKRSSRSRPRSNSRARKAWTSPDPSRATPCSTGP